MHPMTITGRGSGSTAGSFKDKAPEPWRGRLRALRKPSRFLPLAIVCLAQLAGSGPGRADPVPQTMNGVPLLPIPTFNEVGLPAFTVPTGTVPTGNDTPTQSNNTGSGSSGDGSDRPAVATMMSRSWGAAAAANAQSLGVSDTALAVTCVLESNCQSVGGTGTINGAFQMSNATYTAAMAAALQRNPSLAANIVPGLAGKMDPATQSIAAAEYQREGAEYLQAHDMQNPTALDVRGFYNFGPGNALSVAQSLFEWPVCASILFLLSGDHEGPPDRADRSRNVDRSTSGTPRGGPERDGIDLCGGGVGAVADASGPTA